MKFSEKMCFMIISKVTKKQGFILCLEDPIFKKLEGEGLKLTPPPSTLHPNRFRVKQEPQIFENRSQLDMIIMI